MNTEINIVFIGGCGVGKTATIKSLWGASNTHIREEVKGRGVMEFNVIELEPILYSIPEKWLDNPNNINALRTANTIVFVLPSISFGYQEELSFLALLIDNGYLDVSTKIIFAISKVDEAHKSTHKIYSTLEQVFAIERMVHKTVDVYLQQSIDFDDIVCYSSLTKCNIEVLKERIWDNVIKRTNDKIYNPQLPTLVVSGKRGCGKSSTLNVLFGLDFPTNMATACTKYPRVLHIEYKQGTENIEFNLVDLPGIAESVSADIEYANYYDDYLSKASVLLCLSQADTRAYKQDEKFYKRLITNNYLTTKTSIVIGINQIDLLYKTVETPDGIDLSTLSPDDQILHSKIDDLYDNIYKEIFVGFELDKEVTVHPFSAFFAWNTDNLRRKIINLLIK